MKQIFIVLLVIVLLLSATTEKAVAAGKVAGHSALLTSNTIKVEDARVIKLRAYLESVNSPLAPYAETFVREADANNIDWRFVVAIAGVESGYGKRIPAYSYNGWGWGIYGGKVTRFASWDEGITTISHDIRAKYMTRWGAKDIYAIGARYAANPDWANRVMRNMNKIDSYEPVATALPISI
jgi:hypothetical protein